MNKNLERVLNKYALKIYAQNRAAEAMSKYTAMLRALVIIHQHNHWTSKHNTYYGDHLLFERLYTETADHIDGAAERTIGLFGVEALELEQHITFIHEFVSEITKAHPDDTDNGNSLAERSLAAEEAFLDFSKKIYDSLKDSGVMTLGLDDLIMGYANDHEVFVYLLKQRLES